MDMPFFRGENQSSDDPDYIRTHASLVIPYITITSIGMVIGTVGNILVICAVILQKELRSVGNMFIVNLAVADLCVTAFVDPFSILGIVLGSVWFEKRAVLCELIACICLTSCFCSLLTMGAIAINRYIQICHVKMYKKVFTVCNTICMCVGLWVFSFLAELPNFLGWGDHAYDKKTLSCVWDRTADLSYTIFFSVVGVALPIILISICYSLIFKHLLAARSTIKLLQAGKQFTAAKGYEIGKESRQMIRMVFISFVLFAICWLPYAFVVSLDHKDTYPLAVHLYVIVIAHFNSSVNNIVYAVCNDSFRKAYFRLLGLSCCIPATRNNDETLKATPAYEPLRKSEPLAGDRTKPGVDPEVVA